VQNSSDYFSIVRADGTRTYLSPSVERVLGYTPQWLLSQSAFQFIHPQDAPRVYKAFVEALQRPGVSPPVEFRGRHAAGHWLYLESTGYNLCDDPRVRGLVIATRDITERKRAEEHRQSLWEAEIQMAELRKLDQMKDEFLAAVSHDLRTPLTNMKLAISMLERAPLGETHERYLRLLKTECERESELINDLLDLQRLAAGAMALHVTTLDLVTWLPAVVAPFAARAQARELTLEVHPIVGEPTIEADARLLGRVLAELLNNACKYTPPGERVIVRLERDGDQLQLSVTNTGAEIAPEELPRVFDKFHRVAGIDRWGQGGTGLGLALVKGAVAAMGGELCAESGGGRTAFHIVLPAMEPARRC